MKKTFLFLVAFLFAGAAQAQVSCNSTAIPGLYSTAIGYYTSAFGDHGFASGKYSVNYGDDSTSTGYGTQTFGHQCTSEGRLNQTWGPGGFSEGVVTISTGEGAHSEGWGPLAGMVPLAYTIDPGGTVITISGNAVQFFATPGAECQASRMTPAVLAAITTGTATGAVFAGGSTAFSIPVALDSTTTGGYIVNITYGAAAHAEGYAGNVASGVASHVEGSGGSIVSGGGAHGEGHVVQASGVWCHAQNDGTWCTGQASDSTGTGCVASGLSSHAGGTSSNATATGAVVDGLSCNGTGAYASVTGEYCTGSGVAADAHGYNVSSSGAECFGTGLSTRCSGTAGLTSGYDTTASGTLSDAGGQSSTASGQASFVRGLQCTASGLNSQARVSGAWAARENDDAAAGGYFGARGDAQVRRVVMRCSTPGSAAGESCQLATGSLTTNTLDPSKAYMVTVKAVAARMGVGLAARDTAAFSETFLVGDRSGGTVDVGAVTGSPAFQGTSFANATLTPWSSGTNNLTLTFLNDPALAVAARVVALVEFVEVGGT